MNTRTRRAGAAAVAAVAAGAVSFFGANPASAAEPTGLGLCGSVAGLSPGQAAGALGMSVNRVVALCGHVLAAPETQSPAPAPLLAPLPLVGELGPAVGGTVNGLLGGSPQGVIPQTPGTGPAPAAPVAPPAAAVGPAPVSGPSVGALLTPAQFMSYDLGALGGAAFAHYDLALFPGFGSGRIPTFGLLGAEPGSAGGASDIAAAGTAQTLPADAARLAPQVMAAVLVLAGVSAVFVRSWVLSSSTARRPRRRRA